MTKPTARQVHDDLAPYFKGSVESCEICENSNGYWVVRARVQPADKRRRPFEIADIGDTRDLAILKIFQEAPYWASVYHCTP